MLIRNKKSSDCLESEITDRSIYLNRRQFMKVTGSVALGAGGIGHVSAALQQGNPLSPPDNLAASFNNIIKTPFGKEEKITPYDVASSYNNFYEFGYGKSDPKDKSSRLKTTPWTVSVEGEAEKTGVFDLDDIIKESQLEERIYRLRCVEAWSMVIPWVGIPLATILKRFEPNSKAKYVYFETLYDPQQMPGQKGGGIDWPYREGLRIDEAMNSLAFLAVGMYGSILPNQNGAPLRLVLPWKYGFKSIKSIVTIRFVETMPKTSWSVLAPREYGFYANVNPAVDHPRWSQKQERRLPGGVLFPNIVETKMFNGYEEEVGSLYAGMDLKRFY